jgi:hypothetical protein
MKKLIILAIAVTGVAYAGYVAYGFGKALTATTTPAVLNVGPAGNDYAKFMTVDVTGSVAVRIMKNTVVSNFVATNAMIVNPGFPKTFWTGDDIKSICYATESSNTTFTVNFE